MSAAISHNDHFANVLTRDKALKCVHDGVLVIPDGITILDEDFAFFAIYEDLPKVHTLVIPASVRHIISMRGDSSSEFCVYRDNPFAEIIVDKDNQKFASEDGILFTKNMDTLLCYPSGKPGKEYKVPKQVKTVATDAFLSVEHLESISFPDGLQRIEYGAFRSCPRLDFPEVATVYQKENNVIIRISDGRFYDKPSGVNIDCFAYAANSGPFGNIILDIDEDSLNQLVEDGAIYVEDHDERCQILRQFADAVSLGTCSYADDAFALDAEQFVGTFYSDW